jgi:hypothetical protein
MKNKNNSPKDNINFGICNAKGSPRVVVENDILYLSNFLNPSHHYVVEEQVGRELKCIYIDPNISPNYEGENKFVTKENAPRKINKNHPVKVKVYKNKDTGKLHRTELNEFIDKHDTYTRDVKGLYDKLII